MNDDKEKGRCSKCGAETAFFHPAKRVWVCPAKCKAPDMIKTVHYIDSPDGGGRIKLNRRQRRSLQSKKRRGE